MGNKNLKTYEDFHIKEFVDSDAFGDIIIKIDGSSAYKNKIVDDIKKILSNYQGERHLFVDGIEINPHRGY